MPCTPRRARLLLTRRRAVVHRLSPFTIRLKDRTVGESTLQPVVLKIDPGSKTTGLALVRVEETKEGEIHHALHLAELAHRGEEVRERLRKRAGYRRRRRSANLRYRPPRFLNRRRPPGWLPPSLRSRIGNVLTFARRSQHWAPLTRIDVERVKFDTQLLRHKIQRCQASSTNVGSWPDGRSAPMCWRSLGIGAHTVVAGKRCSSSIISGHAAGAVRVACRIWRLLARHATPRKGIARLLSLGIPK